MTASDIDLDPLDKLREIRGPEEPFSAEDLDLEALKQKAEENAVTYEKLGYFTSFAPPAVVLELVRRVEAAEAAASAKLSNAFHPSGISVLHMDWSSNAEWDEIKRLLNNLRTPGQQVLVLPLESEVEHLDEDQMREAGWVRAEKLEQAEADMRAVSAALAEARSNDVIAMGWLADCRIASGDRGVRMLPEFVEYLRGLKAGSDRYEKLRKFNVSQFKDLFQRNLRGEGRFDDLVDAWVPPY